MQQVQLFIKDQSSVYQRVELFNDETISLTQSIQNIKDVAKVFTDFTKTFTIPATKDTNKLFKHYYNFDITGGFDARVKTVGLIKLNGVDFKKGKIKLEGVDLKDNKPNAYRVTFFGDLVDLKDLIGEDLLSDLTWLDKFEKEYSSANVKDNLKGGNTSFTIDSVTYPNAIKTPLISCINRLYYRSSANTEVDGNLWYHAGGGQVHEHGVYWKDLKYSIAVYVIVKAIEVKYSITFSDDFFDYSTEEYSSLMMLMHRKKGEAEADYSTGVRLYSKYISNIFTTGSIASGNRDGNFYGINPTSDGFTTFGDYEVGGGTNQVSYNYSIDIDPDDNNIPYNGYLYFTATGTTNTVLLNSFEGVTGSSVFYEDVGVTRVGSYTVKLEAAQTLSFGVGNIEIDGSIFYWTGSGYDNIGDCGANCVPRSNTVSNVIEESFAWLPTQQLPKMKVLDFLTGIWKVFNLTAYVETDGTIKVQKLDDFYSGASSYDVTEFVDVNTSQVNIALPYKQINFKFKEGKTLLAAKFSQLNNREFATLEYKGENPDNWVGNEYKVELPFEKMVYERLTDENTLLTHPIMYGFMADDNQEPYIGSPLLHYTTLQNPTLSGAGISFRDTTTTHTQITSSIFMPSNQVDFTTNTNENTINFYAELNEWTATVNLNSLFEENYKEYIQDVFNEKRRLTKVKAFLPIRILSKYTLADTFIISGKKYKINSITTNLQTGESDMELLNEV